MELGLDIEALAKPGRKAAPLEAEVARELTPADLGLLATTEREVQAPPLARITDRHHMLARLLAAGTPEGEAAAQCGYNGSRVSVLKASPAFQELLALYRRDVDVEFAPILGHMASIAKTALVEIQLRLEETPDEISIRELDMIASSSLDRVGYPRKQQTESTININLASRLEEARKRAKAAATGDIIEAEVIKENFNGDSDN